MDNSSWIFTDCFDTLLIRKCRADTIKKKWAKIMSEKLHFLSSNNEIYEIRRSTERCLQMRCVNGEFCGNELFEHITKRIAIIHKIDISQSYLKEIIDIMIMAEYTAEINSLKVNETFLQQLKDKNKSMAVISDYHMDGEFLRKIFKHFGIDMYFKYFFTSSDARCNKYKGDLYQYVLDYLGISGYQTEMYGDTKLSDIESARNYGIKGTLVKAERVRKSEDIKNVFKQLESVLVKKRYSVNSLANYAAALYLMIERLYQQCVCNGIERVYFLSREGELLKQLFDKYMEKRENTIYTHYLYVSRRATALANLKLLSMEDFSVAGNMFDNQSLRYFMQTIGFSEDEYNSITERFDLNFEVPIERFAKSGELSLLKSDSEFEKIYNDKIVLLHDCFKKYLQQEDFYKSDKVAIVDVGWNGTIQDNISNFKKDSQVIYGYYCGVISKAIPSMSSQKFGLLFSDIYGRTKDYDVWSFDYTSFERVLTASHAATIGYTFSSKEGNIIPSFKSFDTEIESYKIIKSIQIHLKMIFEQIDKILMNSCYFADDLYAFFIKTHIRTILDIGIKKAKFQQTLYGNQVENFGSESTTQRINNEIFGIKQIIKKAIPRIKVLKNTEIMIKICAQNKLYVIIPIFTWVKKCLLLKKIHSKK